MSDFSPINWKLISHPVNWGIVWVTLLLAGTAYALLHDYVMSNSASSSIIPD